MPRPIASSQLGFPCPTSSFWHVPHAMSDKVYIVCFCVSKVETQDRVPQERSKRATCQLLDWLMDVWHMWLWYHNLVTVHGQETLPRPVDAINSDMPTKQDQTFMAHKLANKLIYFSDWKHGNKLCTKRWKSWMWSCDPIDTVMLSISTLSMCAWAREWQISIDTLSQNVQWCQRINLFLWKNPSAVY